MNRGLVSSAPSSHFWTEISSGFTQPVRDIIGIGFLVVVVAYCLNGIIGSTYVRGVLWVHKAGDQHRGEDWQVSSEENKAIVNDSGIWTVPVYGNGIPKIIHLVVEDEGHVENGRHVRKTIGEVKTFGPWPVWNTLKPMNSLRIDVDLDKPSGQQLTLARNNSSDFFALDTVYAQPNLPGREWMFAAPNREAYRTQKGHKQTAADTVTVAKRHALKIRTQPGGVEDENGAHRSDLLLRDDIQRSLYKLDSTHHRSSDPGDRADSGGRVYLSFQ